MTRQTTNSGDWGESFLIQSCDAQWDFIATVVDRDEAGRDDFLGQALVNAGSYILKAVTTNKKVQEIVMNLGPLQIEPRDTSNKQAMRLDTLSNANKAIPGSISVEIHTFSNLTTKTGFLDEMLSQSVRGAKKKWWAVYLDRTLSLYNHKGDARPKKKIEIRNGTPISWHGNFLKLSAINETFRFTSSNEDDRKDWYSKITGKYVKILQKGAEDYRRQCRRERGEVEGEEEDEEGKGGDGEEDGEELRVALKEENEGGGGDESKSEG